MTAPMERIQTLDAIEKDIILCLQSAGKLMLVIGRSYDIYIMHIS